MNEIARPTRSTGAKARSLKTASRHFDWNLCLYVAGRNAVSATAFRNLKEICDQHLAGRYNIEVIDLMKNPRIAQSAQLVALPAVVRKHPLPVRKIVGDLSNTGRALTGLDIRTDAADRKLNGKTSRGSSQPGGPGLPSASHQKIAPEAFDPHVERLLKSIVVGKHVLHLQKNTPCFSQGDPADAIYFIQSGRVKLTVVSPQGKEAVLAMLGPREFFGEGCLVGQAFRVSRATAIEASTVFRVQSQAMLLGLHAQSELSEKFTASLLARNISLEEDLCDQLFNHSEKRLARVLLKLNRLGQHPDMPGPKMPRLSHETLAEMVGTTRSRITFFMNKFRKLGLIEYKGTGDLKVREALIIDIVLHD